MNWVITDVKDCVILYTQLSITAKMKQHASSWKVKTAWTIFSYFSTAPVNVYTKRWEKQDNAVADKSVVLQIFSIFY